MKQYIDKNALVAEIERRIKNYKEEIGKYRPSQYSLVYDIISKKDECSHILSFINTLEVIEIGVDVGSPEGDWSNKTVQVIDADGNISEESTEKRRGMADKELLLKVICGYLPYALQVRNPHLGGPDYATGIDTETGKLQVLYNGYTDDIEKFKPYLRPLSSMTKDEVKEFQSVSNFKCYPKHIRGAFFDNDYTSFGTFDGDSKFCRITMSNVISCIDWLHKKHFDFRGLIEKGLALPAPDGMYETK